MQSKSLLNDFLGHTSQGFGHSRSNAPHAHRIGQGLEHFVMEDEKVVVESLVPPASVIGMHRVDVLLLADPG